MAATSPSFNAVKWCQMTPRIDTGSRTETSDGGQASWDPACAAQAKALPPLKRICCMPRKKTFCVQRLHCDPSSHLDNNNPLFVHSEAGQCSCLLRVKIIAGLASETSAVHRSGHRSAHRNTSITPHHSGPDIPAPTAAANNARIGARNA